MNATDTMLQPQPYAVADLMSAQPVVVSADASLSDAAQAMDLYDISGLPVVGPSGELIGVISETDLVHARATEWLWSNWMGLKVRHLVSSPPLTISASASLEAATQKMERHHVHRLVVVSDDDPTLPIGVISTSDIVRALARETR